jgi:hypothetical protein
MDVRVEMTVNRELGRTCKEAAVLSFKVLSYHLPGKIAENHKHFATIASLLAVY